MSLWKYLSFGALILSGVVFALLFLSEQSYWLMRLFFAVVIPTTTSLMLLAPIIIVTFVLASLLEFRWRMITTWTIALWVAVFVMSSLSFFGALLTSYEITASATFKNQSYYLVKFSRIDSYDYRLYSCEPLGLFCSRSSGYIGIPYQNDPIYLQYNLKTQKVYIQNRNQTIQIPD
jgi:hypothetical protein